MRDRVSRHVQKPVLVRRIGKDELARAVVDHHGGVGKRLPGKDHARAAAPAATVGRGAQRQHQLSRLKRLVRERPRPLPVGPRGRVVVAQQRRV